VGVEQRFPTRQELIELLLSAPESETRYLREATNGYQLDPYQWLIDRAVDKAGLIINGRPVYIGVLTEDILHQYHIWTIVNSDVKEQFTLYKVSKKVLQGWAERYGKIYATMEKVNPRNMEWTKRLGFKVIEEKDNEITFLLERV
jgi:hypothetical protein